MSKSFWKSTQGKLLIAKRYKAAFLIAFVVILGSLMTSVRADTNINNCTTTQDLNVTGESYFLINNISIGPSDSTCIYITASNITLDCQGYTLDGSSNNTPTAIYVIWNWDYQPDNVTIKNCIVQNFILTGIELENTINSTVMNNTVINNYDNIYIDDNALNIIIKNNTILNGEDTGIRLDEGPDNNTIFDNYFLNNSISIAVYNQGKENNIIFNNYLNGLANIDFPEIPTSHIWNTTRQIGTRIYSAGTQIGGNYWTNSTANGYSDTCTDADTNGFCDDPYDVEANTSCSAVADGLPACGNNTDWLPLSDEYIAPTPPSNPLENLTIAYTYCLTNTTLANINHTNEETGNITTSYHHCNYGCDNITASCNPPQYQSSLIVLGIVIVILIALYKVYKWI